MSETGYLRGPSIKREGRRLERVYLRENSSGTAPVTRRAASELFQPASQDFFLTVSAVKATTGWVVRALKKDSEDREYHCIPGQIATNIMKAMSPSQAKSPPSLTDLPPEIILQVFEHAADFSVVNALNRVDRRFHSVYIAGSPAIYHAVASRIQPEFEYALQLANAQKAAYDASSHLSKDPQAVPPSRNQRLLCNARRAAASSANFYALTQIHLFTRARGNEDLPFRPSERARFKKSFYQFWTICILANTPSLRPIALKFLDKRDVVELAGIDEVYNWAEGFTEGKLVHLGLDFRGGAEWAAGCKMVQQYCHWDRKGKSGYKRMRGVYGDEECLGFWVFFDHTQHYIRQIELHSLR